MDYGKVQSGLFRKRLNRFAAIVEIEGMETIAHVKNTGRLRELFVPGATVYLKYVDHPQRKTQWDLISVEHQGEIVNIDSQAPNYVFGEWVAGGHFRKSVCKIIPEVTYGDSRFDFQLELEETVQFVEVKGVTLLRDGKACFPDAPTERGVKHLRGLMRAVSEGYAAAVVFVIQRKNAEAFIPNDETQPEFGCVLREAAAAGVQIYAYDCRVTERELTIDCPVKVQL